MRWIWVLGAAALVVTAGAAGEGALAATASGNSALALAGVIATKSPLLKARERSVISRLFNGNLNVSAPRGGKIEVKADAVTCRAGNVDITAWSCELKFGANQVELHGRGAHELFATLAGAGVRGDGAAGTIFEGVRNLACTIDVNEIKQKAGGGASCTFDPGSP